MVGFLGRCLCGQVSYTWHVENISVVPGLRLAWEHEFKYLNLPLTASAPALGGATADFLAGRTLDMTRFSLTRTLASKSLPESGPPLVIMDRLPAITTTRTRSQGRLVSAFRASRFLALNKEQTAHWHRFPRKSVHLERSWFFFPPGRFPRLFPLSHRPYDGRDAPSLRTRSNGETWSRRTSRMST